MKIIAPILFAIFILIPFPMMSQTGFVTLDGKQFKIDGQDFYPVAVCYSLGFAFHPGTYNSVSDIMITRNNGYGPGNINNSFFPNLLFESDNQADFRQEILDDFNHIKDMGFNSIRTHGISLELKNHHYLQNSYGFKLTAYSVIPWDPQVKEIVISPPYNSTNTALNHYCDLLYEVLEIADEAELKVIFDIGDRDYAESECHIYDYADLLQGIGAHFKDNNTLMAYSVFEEPYFINLGIPYSKKEICEITTLWYDAIKHQDSDPNHLITIGGGDVLDVYKWDPAVLKIDFYSPHPYTHVYSWEQYSYDKMYDRFLGRLKWLERNCPMPWIVGEIAVGAQDDCWDTEVENEPQSAWIRRALSPPMVTTADLLKQKEFAENSLNAVRNHGGSGYTWWQFQETWWVSYWNPENNHNHDAMGLLRHWSFDPQHPLEKPVVEAFRNYPTHPPAPIAMDQPVNYNNPFYGLNFPFTIYLKDQNNEAIKEGVLYGVNSDPPPYDDASVYAITNSNGSCFFGNPRNGLHSKFDYMAASAIGCETKSIDPTESSTQDIELNRPYNYDLLINTFQTENEAINSITVNNGSSTILVPAYNTAYYYARNEININSTFHAENGSNVHILVASFLFECDNWCATAFEKNNFMQNNPVAKSTIIQLDFIQKKYPWRVYPNPASEIITIETNTGVNDPNTCILLFNSLGQRVMQWNSASPHHIIDISQFPRGLYALKVFSSADFLSNYIIFQ
ncbi:MAG: T9SS type A sorting domain-containing protein [Bacteroidales bacterium]